MNFDSPHEPEPQPSSTTTTPQHDSVPTPRYSPWHHWCEP